MFMVDNNHDEARYQELKQKRDQGTIQPNEVEELTRIEKDKDQKQA